jgi:hypothetical protein
MLVPGKETGERGSKPYRVAVTMRLSIEMMTLRMASASSNVITDTSLSQIVGLKASEIWPHGLYRNDLTGLNYLLPCFLQPKRGQDKGTAA